MRAALLLLVVIAMTEASERVLLAFSGQSNMAFLPVRWFIVPRVRATYRNTAVCKWARFGQSIVNWSNGNWVSRTFDRAHGGSYTKVVWVWMQGERDAKDGMAQETYAGHLLQMLNKIDSQVATRWPGAEVLLVLGRISAKAGDPRWDAIRAAQDEVATTLSLSRTAISVDTRRLSKRIHFFGSYRALAHRFYEAIMQALLAQAS